jgi:hypothetical protein
MGGGVVGWTDGLGGLQVVQQVAVEGLRGSATMHSAVQLIPVHAFSLWRVLCSHAPLHVAGTGVWRWKNPDGVCSQGVIAG